MRMNESRALDVLSIINDGWRDKTGIFSGIVLPQDRYNPEFSDDVEHTNWLFFAALPMRGGIVSEDPFKWLLAMKKRFPEMFVPKIVSKWKQERMEECFRVITKEILNGNGTGANGGGVMSYKSDQHANAWIKNASVLHKNWGGDPRNIFDGCADFESAFGRIDYQKVDDGIKGMRRKIFSLFTIWLQERNLIPIFPTPIPVDFHALRVLFATGIIDWESVAKPFVPQEGKHPSQLAGKLAIRISEKFINEIAMWSQEFLWRSGLPYLNVNPGVWVLSRSLCAEHFQCSSRGDGKMYVDGIKRIKWPKKYGDPCSACPVSEFCKWMIPAAPYYRWGLVVRLGERIVYPQAFLPGVDWPYNARKNSRK